MNNTNNDDGAIEKTAEEVAAEKAKAEAGKDGEETTEQLKERLDAAEKAKAKAEEIANNQRIRAEKAEGKHKETTTDKKETTETKSDISTGDLYALMEAKVPQEDVAEIAEYAKFKKISVTDALKDDVIKTILRDKAEKRATAEAASTGTSKRTTGKVTDETLLEKANKGEMPESEEDIARLAAARRMKKK